MEKIMYSNLSEYKEKRKGYFKVGMAPDGVPIIVRTNSQPSGFDLLKNSAKALGASIEEREDFKNTPLETIEEEMNNLLNKRLFQPLTNNKGNMEEMILFPVLINEIYKSTILQKILRLPPLLNETESNINQETTTNS